MDKAQLGAGSTVAIIGGGQAGGEAATLLRQNRFEGRIVLIGEEDSLPYMRPPLVEGVSRPRNRQGRADLQSRRRL